MTNRSEQINELADALASAQGEFPSVERNRSVSVRMKTGGEYEFEYATLDNIIKSVRPAMSKHGLAFTQMVVGSDVVTTIMHKSGQWISSSIPMKFGDGTGPQAFGSAITYAKRYSLSAMLGIAPDDDDDVNAAEGNIVKRNGQKTAAPDKKAEFWGGPLGKTEFREALRAFSTDMQACSDLDEFTALMNQKESISLMNQCKTDAPGWWYTQGNSDVKGLSERIDERRKELMAVERA